MMLFGSALGNARGEDYFEKMVSEAVKQTNEAKQKMAKAENASQLIKVNSIMERVTDFEGIAPYEAKQLGLIYNNLAPDDISHPISAKMVKNFLERVVKVQNPEAYEKICRYYDFKNQLPEKAMKKLSRFVENTWNKYRTVEYCYMYSKAFHDFVNHYAVKVDADGLDNLEKIKWLRLWLFVIKDQGFFWTDIQANGTIIMSEQLKFDQEVYLFPDCVLYLEEYIREYLPDKALNVEMLKRFIGLYPEDVQKQVYTWAEMDGDTSDNMLRAGEIRMGIKRQLFPITWMSPMSLFCLNNNMKDNNPEYLEAAVRAYKNGGIENLDRIEQRGTDPFDRFKVKSYKSYEVYTSPEENGRQQVLVVNAERELEMFVEVYKWLLEHPDFKFGPENKSISQYGIEHLLEDEKKINAKWFLETGLVDSEDDINWVCLEKILKGKEELLVLYFNGEIDIDEVYNEIGFSTDMQAKLCCNQKIKLIPVEANKMAAALKRIKMFGESAASKSDLIYLEIFRYFKSEKIEQLSKSIINIYGNLF